ncbi:MAG: DNA polymerase I [Clostridia bacterium]|nr:DNA polymerase I [Clostridia bacterium]
MKLLIIDGNSILNRAFYAIKNLTAPDGLHTGGIYGFLVTLFKTMDEEAPDMVTVAFDVKAPTFRHKAYALYKATRHGMPEELAEQLPVLKEVLAALRIPILELAGYEADDIIGTIAALCEKADVDCRILTGDRDDLQLVSDKTKVLLTTTAAGKTETVLYDTAAVQAKYGVSPRALIEVKGLMGDSSDNIPGVMGVGEKTALSLITKYETIEGVYAHIADGEIRGALLNKLQNGKDSAFLSRELGTICREVPLSVSLDDLKRRDPDAASAAALFARLRFQSLAKHLEMPAEVADEAVEAVAEPYKGQLANAETIYLCQEGDILYAAKGEAVYQMDWEAAKPLLANEACKKVCHGMKNLLVLAAEKGCKANGFVFDTALAAYLLDPARQAYGLPALCETYLSKRPADMAAAATLIPDLEVSLSEELEKREQTALYREVELPLAALLAEMQIEGVLVEKEQLASLSAFLEEKLQKTEAEIYALAGCTFNIQSPKQLGSVLFETLQLPVIKKTKSGYSTDVSVLEKLAPKHPIVAHVLEYRQLAKLKSTYADGLTAVIHPETGRIHSTFHQTVTTTGRISSADPNLQNIPVRSEMGREIRKVFVAREGYSLVDADYSQIELRVLAHMAKDARMQEAFLHGEDIHTHTASEIFGVPECMVTPEMRSRAKTINFGIVYGMGDFTLAGSLGVSRKEAHAYIESYMETYSGVRAFMQKSIETARENGYVKTILNRRRYIPEITSTNYNVRAFGERVAMNAPIQGSAADIIKLAMLRVAAALKEKAPRSRLILQVHDELIVEAHAEELSTVQILMRREMENAYALSVPMTVDIGTGESWYAAK